jgi:hypothetical protein
MSAAIKDHKIKPLLGTDTNLVGRTLSRIMNDLNAQHYVRSSDDRVMTI